MGSTAIALFAFFLASPIAGGSVAGAQGRKAPTAGPRRSAGAVAAEHPLAVQAGIAVLEEGGNAVDAAVAAALTACVVSPSSCGLGGGGFMLIYDAPRNRTYALDYREEAPAALTVGRLRRGGKLDPALLRSGALAVGVPGEVAGLLAAQRRLGRLPRPALFAPAIASARDGFAVSEHLAAEIRKHRALLAADPGLAALYLHADGTPLQAGEKLVEPDLARTLAAIASAGASAFYRGRIAAAIAATVRGRGGVLTTADLASYRPRWRRPIVGHYRGNTVLVMPPPSSAGLLVEMLAMLAHDDLSALGRSTPTFLHLLAEVMKRAFADRARYYGDPATGALPAFLLSPSRALRLRRTISAAAALPVKPERAPAARAASDAGTSHLSVIDADGSAVACTTTINTGFGAGILVPGTGIILNNEMDDFSLGPSVPNVYGLVGSAANALAPGRRPLSSMAPTVLLGSGGRELVLGGSGGPTILSATLQVILGALDFGESLPAAIAAPRIHHQWRPDVLLVEPGLDPGLRAALGRYGHVVREVRSLGAVSAVAMDAAGRLGAAGDPRKGGAGAVSTRTDRQSGSSDRAGGRPRP